MVTTTIEGGQVNVAQQVMPDGTKLRILVLEQPNGDKYQTPFTEELAVLIGKGLCGQKVIEIPTNGNGGGPHG